MLREEAELEVKSLEKMSQHDGNLWVKPPGDPGALRCDDVLLCGTISGSSREPFSRAHSSSPVGRCAAFSQRSLALVKKTAVGPSGVDAR